MTVTATPTVTVRILLFASYAERLGVESLELRLPGPAAVSQAIERLRALPGGSALPARPLCALNLEHVTVDHMLSDGDELAILPPLAGG
jgi:molybdopterin converting factor small subunit